MTTHTQPGPCLDCGGEHYLIEGRCILHEHIRLREKARASDLQEDWDALSDFNFYVEDQCRR